MKLLSAGFFFLKLPEQASIFREFALASLCLFRKNSASKCTVGKGSNTFEFIVSLYLFVAM